MAKFWKAFLRPHCGWPKATGITDGRLWRRSFAALTRNLVNVCARICGILWLKYVEILYLLGGFSYFWHVEFSRFGWLPIWQQHSWESLHHHQPEYVGDVVRTQWIVTSWLLAYMLHLTSMTMLGILGFLVQKKNVCVHRFTWTCGVYSFNIQYLYEYIQ